MHKKTKRKNVADPPVANEYNCGWQISIHGTDNCYDIIGKSLQWQTKMLLKTDVYRNTAKAMNQRTVNGNVTINQLIAMK